METIRIATTPQQGLHRLGTGGQPVTSAYDQLARYLQRALGDNHARLLAEPNDNPGQAAVDWYAEGEGEVVRYVDADPDRKRAIETRLAQLRDEIASRAAELSRSGQGGDRLLGQMLELALEVPSEDYIYAFGDQPVLTCWGTLTDAPRPERGILRKFVPYSPPRSTSAGHPAAGAATPGGGAPPSPPPPLGGVAMAGAGGGTVVNAEQPLWWLAWLLWLVFGLLVAAIFIVLLSGCGVSVPGFGWLGQRGLVNYCPVPVQAEALAAPPELEAEQARQQVLEDELRRLQLEIAAARRQCGRPEGEGAAPAEGAPSETPPADAGADPDADFDSRLDREGGQRGEVTVTLMWNSDADLDLHVECPGDRSIFYGSPRACGGELDVDMNVGGAMSSEPVENIVWPEGALEPGTYRVIVNNFNSRSDGETPTPYRVRLIRGDQREIVEGEIATADDRQTVLEFDVP